MTKFQQIIRESGLCAPKGVLSSRQITIKQWNASQIKHNRRPVCTLLMLYFHTVHWACSLCTLYTVISWIFTLLMLSSTALFWLTVSSTLIWLSVSSTLTWLSVSSKMSLSWLLWSADRSTSSHSNKRCYYEKYMITCCLLGFWAVLQLILVIFASFFLQLFLVTSASIFSHFCIYFWSYLQLFFWDALMWLISYSNVKAAIFY